MANGSALSADNKKAQLQRISEKLEQGAKDVFGSSLYRDYLKMMASFHTYSYRNSLLIFLQNPNATHVAGFNRWKELGRTVGRGEKGIAILAPAPYKKMIDVSCDENGELLPEPVKKVLTVPAFKVAYVFDVSQTHGRELPALARRLTGEVPEFDQLFAALDKASPYPIEFEQIARASSNGYCNFAERRIAIREGISQQQAVKTAIHEMAHALMHSEGGADRQAAEMQAESVAFIVSEYLGIDTSDYSFGYIAGWSSGKDAKELGASMAVIQQQAHGLIDTVEQHLELQQQRQAEQMTPAIPHTLEEHIAYFMATTEPAGLTDAEALMLEQEGWAAMLKMGEYLPDAGEAPFLGGSYGREDEQMPDVDAQGSSICEKVAASMRRIEAGTARPSASTLEDRLARARERQAAGAATRGDIPPSRHYGHDLER